jgi:hypothetical protein
LQFQTGQVTGKIETTTNSRGLDGHKPGTILRPRHND